MELSYTRYVNDIMITPDLIPSTLVLDENLD